VVGATIPEAEISRASAKTVIEVLVLQGALPPSEFARLFVENLVIEILATELMAVLNDGSHPPEWVRDVQTRMEGYVHAVAARLDIPDATATNLEAVIREVLPHAQAVLAAEMRAG
jgi:hypothetical protein